MKPHRSAKNKKFSNTIVSHLSSLSSLDPLPAMSASRLFNLDLSFIHNFSAPSIVNANAGAATIEVITGRRKENEDALSGRDELSQRRRGTLTSSISRCPLPAATHKHTRVEEAALSCRYSCRSIFVIMWQLPPAVRRVHLLGGLDGPLL